MKRIFSPAPVRQAFDWADQWTLARSVRELPLEDVVGYTLAEDLQADGDIPPQPHCARDGFALQAGETLGAGDYNPLPLRLVSAASMGPGTAVRVSAGDPLPTGADAVLTPEQGDVRDSFLDVASSLAPGEGVIQCGEACRRGERLLHAGRRLRPQDLAWVALAGHDRLKVLGKPRVQLCLAGRFERDADGPMLMSLVKRDGGDLTGIDRVSTHEDLVRTLTRTEVDLILLAGGSGYGFHDQAVQALQACGRVELDGVTIHPGGGLVLGEVAGKAVLLLPGAPLSCLCAYDLLGARLLRRLAGLPGILPYRRQSFTLSRKLVSRIGQMELARIRIDGEHAEPLVVADDRLLASSVRADGFVLVAENSEGYAQGSGVEVHLYDEYD
jgi:molybdopterin molybdotransferase